MTELNSNYSEKIITVLIPTFNHEDYIEETLRSVMKQTIFQNCIVIVSDDGSNDNTCNIAADLIKDFDNMHLRRNPTNLGVIPHYRELTASVETEFLAIIEGDDYCISTEKLSSLHSFLRCFPLQEVVFGGFRLVSETGKSLQIRPDIYSAGRSGLLFFEDLLLQNHIASFSNCMFRTDSFKTTINSPNAVNGFDWYINLILASRAPIGFLGGEFGAYRVHDRGLWPSQSDKDKRLGVLVALEAIRLSVGSRFQSLIDAEIARLKLKELQ